MKVLAAVALLSLTAANADAYPIKPVRVIVPYAPGGGNDIIARALAQKLTESWGQQVIVDNRSGGATVIGTDLAAKSPPDGYTLLFASTSLAINPSLLPRLPYDTLRDFEAITQLQFQPYIFSVNPKLPARDVKEFIAYAKARPGALNYGSTGTGSGAHLAGELLKITAGVDATHIPYKGMAPALADIVGGQTQFIFGTILAAMPHVKSGRLRALAMSSARRSAALPELPTIAEAGVPGFSATSWSIVLVPAGTPRTVQARLNADMVRVLQMAEIRDRLASDGAEPVGNSAKDMEIFLHSEIAKWAKVIKAANLKPE